MEQEKKELLKTSTDFWHLLKPNQKKTLREFSKIIQSHYCISNIKIKTLCNVLDNTTGEITINRYQECFLKFETNQ
jgi:hypothetical protein